MNLLNERKQYEHGIYTGCLWTSLVWVVILTVVVILMWGCTKEPELATCYECHNREMIRFTYCDYSDEEWAMTVAYWIERGDPLECKTIKTEIP